MLTILEQWKTLPREDLFLFWQKESELKRKLHQQSGNYREIKIENEAEFIFLRHSLAYSDHKDIFHIIVFLNMGSLQVQSALLNGPAELTMDFLRSLPRLIRQEKPTSRDIQFLINIYREDFHPYYEEIVDVLKREDCDYLLERTASKKLRQLLKQHQAEIAELSKDNFYGLLENVCLENPGLYGDKISIIRQVIKNIRSSSLENYDNPNEISRIKAILETVDLLFMAGLLSDSLALLLVVYQQEQKQVRPEAEERLGVYKAINNSLYKILPMYALLSYPLSASRQVMEIYQTNFPSLIPSKNSLVYLNLYHILIASRQGNIRHTIIELAQNYAYTDHSEDDPLSKILYLKTPISEENLIQVLDNVQKRLITLPYEAFIIMEILRYLEQNQIINFTGPISSLLLNNYLLLFHWLPCPLFINAGISAQLGPTAEENLRHEIDRILSINNDYPRTYSRALYSVKPEFSEDTTCLEKQLFLGSFLGVF